MSSSLSAASRHAGLSRPGRAVPGKVELGLSQNLNVESRPATRGEVRSPRPGLSR
jgi:hypothetical protein